MQRRRRNRSVSNYITIAFYYQLCNFYVNHHWSWIYCMQNKTAAYIFACGYIHMHTHTHANVHNALAHTTRAHACDMWHRVNTRAGDVFFGITKQRYVCSRMHLLAFWTSDVDRTFFSTINYGAFCAWRYPVGVPRLCEVFFKLNFSLGLLCDRSVASTRGGWKCTVTTRYRTCAISK